MAYPKPWSERTIKKKYEEAGLKEAKIEFIRTFFKACANLYGAIELGQVWGVYKEYASHRACMKVKKKEFLQAAAIMRREPNDFYVYEGEEIYLDLANKDIFLHIVNKDLIAVGYGKDCRLQQLVRAFCEPVFFVPEDFLCFADASYTYGEDEKAFSDFIGNLVVNMDEYEDEHSHMMRPCSGHKGEKLADFKWLTRFEQSNLEYARGEFGNRNYNAKEETYYLKEYDRTVAEKILFQIKDWDRVAVFSPQEIVKYTMLDLEEIGVGLSEEQFEEFVDLFQKFHNHMNMWFLRGWSPADYYKGVASHQMEDSVDGAEDVAEDEDEIDEDDFLIKLGIRAVYENQQDEDIYRLLCILKDCQVWVPCNSVISDEDEAYILKMLEEAGGDPGALKGKTLTSQKEIRLVPDILESEGELFFPVFSSEEEMGEYGEHFSHIPMAFVDALEMAKNHEENVRGIVVNAFTESFAVVRELFEVFEQI
ncbi:MAG: SseB family protein [Dorea sp.]|nr:SseB family protein [Dorea sp.]